MIQVKPFWHSNRDLYDLSPTFPWFESTSQKQIPIFVHNPYLIQVTIFHYLNKANIINFWFFTFNLIRVSHFHHTSKEIQILAKIKCWFESRLDTIWIMPSYVFWSKPQINWLETYWVNFKQIIWFIHA